MPKLGLPALSARRSLPARCRAVTRTRKLRRRAGFVAVLLVFAAHHFATPDRERLELNGHGIDTSTTIQPAGVPFSFEQTVVANDGDEPMTLLSAEPVRAEPGHAVSWT